ncbi:MAG: thioredoxin domain-containing protein [Actinobacteria bacterium]|nr:thioredoxin domain-containing protein [Actinomycetota bacterium]
MKENDAAREDAREVRGDFRFSPRPNRAHEIGWLPWGEEAFSRAAREEKPILLSISAVWCHWCHVMDETTYSDPEVIELVNRNYVPVRVDNDRNPDINRRYNQGGWPTTAFLSSRGTLLAGATYIPPETMRRALARISELYRRNRLELEGAEGRGFTAGGASGLRPASGNVPPPDASLVHAVGESVLAAWDREFGGLGLEPKFPFADALALALHLHRRGGGEEYLALVTQSLRAMIEGNLRDDVEGGFFRYSTTRDWSLPHYEKMLGDNAALLTLLLRAYGAAGEPLFLATAAETASYIFHTLSDGERRFFGSQDADEGYYTLPADARRRKSPPPVDGTTYTDTSSLAASSLLEAGTVLGRKEYRELALGFLAFAWEEIYRAGEGMAHYHDGSPRRRGLLEDQVEAALAMQGAYGITGDPLYLDRAEILLRFVLDAFWERERGVLLDVAAAFSPPGLQPQAAGPGSAARAAEAMLRQWHLGGGSEWKTAAEAVLASQAEAVSSHSLFAAPLALALDLLLQGPLLVRVEGDGPHGRGPFLAAALLSPDHRVILLSKPATRTPPEGPAYAEVCGEDACFLRSEKHEELAAYLGVKSGIIKEKRPGRCER